MAALDIGQLIADMKTAAPGVINQDVSSVRGFAEAQLKAIADQSNDVAQGFLDGSIPLDQNDYQLAAIKEMAGSFANALAGLLAVVIEKIWNALVGVVWTALNAAVPGLDLMLP